MDPTRRSHSWGNSPADKFRNDFSDNLASRHQTTSTLDAGSKDRVSRRVDGTAGGRRALKTYVFRCKALRTDLQIFDANQPVDTPAYYASVTALKPNTPDVILHAGSDASGPVLAVAHFRYSRHITLGLGDPVSDAAGIVWEEMHRESILKNKFTFEFSALGDGDIKTSSPKLPVRRHFVWHRTTDAADGVQGLTARMSFRNYRLVDLDREAVVAVFLADTSVSLTKRGELRIFEKLSPDLETIVILGCASISERVHRD